MAAEKNFENKVKRWLASLGIYALGTPNNKMPVPPIGYYEKRWGGGYSKRGLPDMHIVIKNISIEVELKGENGTPEVLQIKILKQIIRSGCYGILLYPDDYELFQKFIHYIIKNDEVNAARTYEPLKSKWKHFENKMNKGE